MVLQTRVTALAIALLLLAACAPQQPGMPVTGETAGASTPTAFPELPAEAVQAAAQWLATQLNSDVDQLKIIEAEQAEWTDSCLGLGKPNESCLRVTTPGWKAVFEVNGQRYEVRTDQTASIIRLASPAGTQTGLENTQWNLVSFGTSGAEESLVEGSSITLLFGGGQAGGFGGCNTYGGIYQVDKNIITFGELVRTEVACADEKVTEQEQRYFQALQSAMQFEVDGDQLKITYDGGNGVLVFDAASPATPSATPGS